MSHAFQFLVAGYSEQHTRPYNQDRIHPAPDTLPAIHQTPLCVAVADGMGGTQQGAEAANLAVQAIPTLQQSMHQTPPPLAIPVAFHNANKQIIDRAGGPGISGTTLSLLMLDKATFWVGHLGDSRIYLWREQKLHALTTDDNAFGSLTRQGYIAFHPQQHTLTQEDRAYLTQHQLFHSELFYIPQDTASTPTPHRSLGVLLQGQIERLHEQGQIIPVGATRERLMWALGKQENIPLEQTHPTPPHVSTQLQAGDLFLLCTDGLHGVFTHEELQSRVQKVAQRLDPHQAQSTLLSWGCDFLLQEACDAGANDNISLLLVQTLPNTETVKQEEMQEIKPEEKLEEKQKIKPSSSESHRVTPLASKQQTVLTPSDRKIQTTPHSSTISPPQKEIASPTQLEQTNYNVNFNHHKDTVKKKKPLTRNITLLYTVIGALVVLLLVSLLSKSSLKESNPPKLRPTKNTNIWKPGSPVASFWLPLPKEAHKSIVAHRMAAFRTLYHSYHVAQSFWQFSPETHQPLVEALRHPALRYHQLLKTLAKTPLEAQHFQAWDHAIQHAMHRLLVAIAPKYQKYLDEMGTPVPLPAIQSSLTLPKQTQHQLRKQILQRWQQHQKYLRWKSWQISLATERITLYSTKKNRTTPTHLKRCRKHLQQAHRLLQQKNPDHTLLPALQNRIQLYEAMLKKVKE